MDLDRYPIPVSLRDCHIENSVVAFKYRTPFHWTYVQDRIVDAYTQLHIYLEEYPLVNENELKSSSGSQMTCYSNGVFKILVEGMRINFNCVDDYPGWCEYRQFIDIAMRAIPAHELLFLCAGIRYISRYENINIFNKLDGHASLNQYHYINGAEIRFPIQEDADITGLVRVTNMLPVVNKQIFASYVDVDVRKNIETPSVDDILNVCEQLHTKEKQYFFKLVSHDFVEELGPAYE